MATDHTIAILIAGMLHDRCFKSTEPHHNPLHTRFQNRTRTIRIFQAASRDAIAQAITAEHGVICKRGHFRYPLRLRFDNIKQVTVRDQKTPTTKGFKDEFIGKLNIAKLTWNQLAALFVSQERIMIAGYIKNIGALLDQTFNIFKDRCAIR